MIICLTGPMAAGKNAASDILEKMGFVCVDADKLGHKAVENSSQKIIEAFKIQAQEKNIELTNPDGSINRKKLGSIVFSSPQNVALQESIVYPEINRLIEEFLEENKNRNSVLNATVLYKIPAISRVDFILYVDCPWFIRLFRAKKRDGITYKQIFDRFKAQKNLFAKYKFLNADIQRVWNIGTTKLLEKKIAGIVSAFRG